jgi:hypothetical protein
VTSYAICGRTVTLPVHVRAADSWAAQYLVPHGAAQGLLPPGLRPAGLLGRSLCSLAFVRYRDSDLESYNEFAVGFLARGAGDVGIYIHRLPVTEEFTLHAGRDIWGYPKVLADIEITEADGRVRCRWSQDGQHVLTLEIRGGGPLPVPQRSTPTFSYRDGVLRRTPWDMRAADRGMRLGGASLELGPHPAAAELRSLGLPKRALTSTTMRGLEATFGAAATVG